MFKTESDAQSEFGLKFEIHFWLRSSRLERTQASIRVTGFDKFASIRLIRSKLVGLRFEATDTMLKIHQEYKRFRFWTLDRKKNVSLSKIAEEKSKNVQLKELTIFVLELFVSVPIIDCGGLVGKTRRSVSLQSVYNQSTISLQSVFLCGSRPRPRKEHLKGSASICKHLRESLKTDIVSNGTWLPL